MVKSAESVHLTTVFFLARLTIKQYLVHILRLFSDDNSSLISRREEKGGRNGQSHLIPI